ncbi:MAG TPA: O-antigen ligase family protein [Thermoanaerobaculia bacterium]
MIRHLRLPLTGLLAALLLFAPLPFGGATPWAASALQALALAALVLAALTLDRPARLRPAALPAAALAAIATLGAVQSLPWPEGLVERLSPRHAELQRQAAALPGVEGGGAARLTLAPAASAGAARSWAAAAAVLLAGAAAGLSRSGRRALAAAVLAGALFQVFFGAQQWFANSLTLWGVEIPRSPRLHGTFINPNHLALYLEMALAVAFAALWWGVRRAQKEPHMDRRLLLVAVPGLLWLTLFTGLAFTGSRGGLLAAVAGVAVQGLLVAAARRDWRAAALGCGAAAAGVAVVAAVGLREGLGRILATTAGDTSWLARWWEYGAVIDLWKRFPVTGSGLGTFRDAFPLVQPAGLQGTWWHAHSDLLELLATTGVVGLLLLAAGAVLPVRRLLGVLRGHGRSEDRGAALAALGALAAVGLHEALDFGLTLPGNSLTLAVLIGAALAVEPSPAGGSKQAHGAGSHAPSAEAAEVEDVQPRSQGDGKAERTRRKRRKRA